MRSFQANHSYPFTEAKYRPQGQLPHHLADEKLIPWNGNSLPGIMLLSFPVYRRYLQFIQQLAERQYKAALPVYRNSAMASDRKHDFLLWVQPYSRITLKELILYKNGNITIQTKEEYTEEYPHQGPRKQTT